MKKRFLAVLAMIAMISAVSIGSALAERPEDAGPPSQEEKCERSGGKANGCENHPGEHEDDEEEMPGLEALCEPIRGIDEGLDDAGIQELSDGCRALEDAITDSLPV